MIFGQVKCCAQTDLARTRPRQAWANGPAAMSMGSPATWASSKAWVHQYVTDWLYVSVASGELRGAERLQRVVTRHCGSGRAHQRFIAT